MNIQTACTYKESFVSRHIGSSASSQQAALDTIGYGSLDALSQALVPSDIQLNRALDLPAPLSEVEALEALGKLAAQNQVKKSYIGTGYANSLLPGVIQRNILENPGWYTQYTPYQAEISQGRLESLLNFQTLISELTALPIANASLLDESTAAAEAMFLCHQLKNTDGSKKFFVSRQCHPQTIEVVQGRAAALDIEVVVGKETLDPTYFGYLLQYPATNGSIEDHRTFVEKAHDQGALVAVACDLLSLTLLTPPGEWGADIAVGTSQRFGVPMGFGGPHAAFFATREENKRLVPGRIVGISVDQDGAPAYRLALQTREQHIRREKATSNICTAQALLANIAAMYAVYHGPEGLIHIAERIHSWSCVLATGAGELGHRMSHAHFFDTVHLSLQNLSSDIVQQRAEACGMNVRCWDSQSISISLDETTTAQDVETLLTCLHPTQQASALHKLITTAKSAIPPALHRTSTFLSQGVFHQYRSETELLRYIKRLEARDFSLTDSMIPLGSCTMKLNATTEMFPISWPAFAHIHPFAPKSQTRGYQQLFTELEAMLAEITGFDGVSLQPNSGAQGEYAGLLAIRAYHAQRKQQHRTICLIPTSAHGTNPASAHLAGLQVVEVQCNPQGDVDLQDLETKAQLHATNLAAMMITYPSTHGVFESSIRNICTLIHQHGGQVYLDGANLNAQLGLCRPGDFGADVCHINLHKTFCIPHGGGGPGVGPIAVKQHLIPFLPGHTATQLGSETANHAVCAAPWGSAGILPISWCYIRMMGAAGLKQCAQVAVLNANYIAQRLEPHYSILYKGSSGLVAHECIVDIRKIRTQTGIDSVDIAKRLADYGFHAPTVSFPVSHTLMIEPTESESKEELDRFCDAMLAIREEIREIEEGRVDQKTNVVKQAPHTAACIAREPWDAPYSREKAAFPLGYATGRNKFWPSVRRINEAYGDRNLCTVCIG